MKKIILSTTIALFSILNSYSQSPEIIISQEKSVDVSTTEEITDEPLITQNISADSVPMPESEFEIQSDSEKSNSTDILAESENLVTTDFEQSSENEEPQDNLKLNEIENFENNNFTESNLEEESAETESTSQENTEPEQKYINLDLPGSDKPQTEQFRQLYLQPRWQKLLFSYLEDGKEYRLYVRKALEEAEMPAILEYLPVVESNYNPKAKSKSGALGMWQFMENSVKPFMALNDFVDQRLDPWKSTEAAILKLKDNYKIFNDWTLAIAAYNCGAGAMKKALSKAEIKDFWYLAENNLISKQTADYIPKLLAIADLATNSEYYDINLPLHQDEYEIIKDNNIEPYDFVTVSKAYSLTQLASELKISHTLLKRLNPSYILDMTHPVHESILRFPQGMENSARAALNRMTPIDFPMKYTVVAGDSLWSISRKYNCTVQAICDINGIKENDILRIGKILYIPKK